MNRRTLLVSGLLLSATPGLAGCNLMEPPPLVIACDADLAAAMERAAEAWPDRRGAEVVVATDINPRELGLKMDQVFGGVVATREEKNANRLQRTGRARLADRWSRQTPDGPIALVVTRGDFQAEHESKLFARWAASPAADRFFIRAAGTAPAAGAISI
ncbi:MAG: hypothetical protein KF842_11700 [Caulobacter sp.]|nr:hypothetical protein [Caulobacter sp.]